MREFAHEFVYEIRTNSYEFLARKIGYVTNGLYCTKHAQADNEYK